MKRCEECDAEFIPYMARQKFCCRVCSDAWYASERRQAVEFFRQQRNREATEERRT